MKNKLALLLFFTGISMFVNAQSGKYRSLLWKISGKGMKKESFLYGTMHVSNRVAYHLSDGFFDALKNTDVVGLETNPSEWLYNMELIGELGKASGVGLYSPFNGNFYQSVFGMKFPDKQVYQTILSFDPEIINALLYRTDKSQDNFQENTYIDLFIFQAASKLNKKVISLEDFRQAEIMAKMAQVPDSDLRGGTEENDYLGRDVAGISQKIEDAYRRGDLDAIDSLSQFTESKNMQAYLLHQRNIYFVQTIDSVLKSGKSLFSGVGAAHLPGKKGVIELLRAKGYAVEAVLSKQSKQSLKEQQKIEAIVKQTPREKHVATDSLYSVVLPGRVSNIMDYDNLKYFIHADMVNGNFYTIARLKTNAVLNNLTTDQMLMKLDSMFFENIPGKIQSKKSINNNGYSGYDIVSRTRGGDLERYHIYVTEMEMLLFKLGGKGEYVNSSAGKEFFSSIRFENKTTNQSVFEPATKGFKAVIPNEYNYSRNDYVGVVGLVEDLSAFDRNTKMYFGVKHAIYNDFYYLEEDTFELNRLAAYTLENFGFKNEIKTVYTSEYGIPAIRLTAVNSSGLAFHGLILVKGIHYYLAYSIGQTKNNEGFNHAFLRSFKLTDFNYLCEIKEIKDVELGFKTKDETSSTAAAKFNEQLNKVYKAIKDSLNPSKVNYYDFDYYSKTKNYYSPSSHEYVEIFFEKYNDFDFRVRKDFSERVRKNLGELLTMRIRTIREKEENGIWFSEYQLTDTATVRAIRVKLFVKSGAVYQVKVPLDTVAGLTGWAKEFYESFTPTDTVIGKNIFENKFKKLLDDLVSADTALSKKAAYSLSNSLAMEKAYLDDFISFLNSEHLSRVTPEVKAQLFVNGGVMGSDKIIDVYRKLYDVYSDSAYLQICLLKGLAYCKTQKAHNAIAELFLKEPPLVGDVGIVNDVLRTMQDSLELCAPLFPKLLKLTENNEYAEPVYKLLSILMKSGLVSVAQISSVKARILADANSELKRFNSAQSGKTKQANQYNNFSSKDAGIEETIDLIKANLRDMSTKAMLKNKIVKDVFASSRQPLLLSFIYILAPAYQSDPGVKSFIDKTARIRNEQIALPAHICCLKHRIPINDTLTAYYAGNVFTRSYFYSELLNEGIQHYFPKNLLLQEKLVESALKSVMKAETYASYEPESKDSLYLDKTFEVKNKYEKGTLYVFKTQKNKFGLNKWSVAFVSSDKPIKPVADIQVIKVNEVFNEKLSEQEIYARIQDDFSNNFRTRINNSAGGITFDY
jgi:uncharacterized protein YbaP (TraB family)